jgi:hypothetical protein
MTEDLTAKQLENVERAAEKARRTTRFPDFIHRLSLANLPVTISRKEAKRRAEIVVEEEDEEER